MRSLRYTVLAAALLFAATTTLVMPGLPTATAPIQAAPPKEETPLADRVNQSIKEGVSFLRNQQTKSGNWEVDTASITDITRGGWSGLALLALLNCGVPADDPDVKRGLEYLRTIDTDSTYVLSLQTMVLIQAGQDVDKPHIQKNLDRLLDTRMKDGWTYGRPNDKSLTGADNSNTQYALLALHEGLQAGYNVDREVIKKIQTFYKTSQHDNGSWEYSKAIPGARITMTTAGLCGLYITGMDLSTGLQKLNETTGKAENCGMYEENPNVTRAIKWLSARIPSHLDANTIREQRITPVFYALYGLERAGRMSGQRYLGEHDWYRIGCEFLVESQKTDGSWKGEKDGNTPGEPWPVVATSFALLFLSKGRTPVLVTKLAYGRPTFEGWNNKHNDARFLTAFASEKLFKRQPMAWQVFDVRNKTADGKADRRDLAAELLQSPLVYFNGHTEAPSGKEEEILKEYVENGGFIFAEACCGEPKFQEEFQKLMMRMFDTKATPLPPNHPVWTSKFLITPEKPFQLWGVERGCKTVAIFSPGPISGFWEANQSTKGNGKIAFELGANIIAYATGLEPPKPKGKEVPIFRGEGKVEHKRGYLEVVQLKHGRESQPAPNAMRNLMVETRKVGLDVRLETKLLSPTNDVDIPDYNFFYMHGKGGFNFTTADLKALRFKLEDQGTLLADACCGSADFDKAFHKFIDDLFDHKLKLEDIPPSDLLFSKKLNGEAIETVRCRLTAGKEPTSITPKLQGVKFEGRWIVIYSQYDLGCALEHTTAPDCLGHDYESAVRLGRAAVLYHLNR